MSHNIYLCITAGDKNTAESMYNQLVKQADKGRVEFGVDIEIERINKPTEEIDFSQE